MMIQCKKVECQWCHRPIHAVLRGAVYIAECSVCADEFTVGELCPTMTHGNTIKDGDNNESMES